MPAIHRDRRSRCFDARQTQALCRSLSSAGPLQNSDRLKQLLRDGVGFHWCVLRSRDLYFSLFQNPFLELKLFMGSELIHLGPEVVPLENSLVVM